VPNKNGLILLTPTSVDKTGTGSTATISTNGSVEFSACATLSLNGVFSADYDNYMVVMRQNGTGTNTWTIQYRLRASGTDNSTASSYVYQRLDADSTTISASRTTSNIWYFSASTGSGYGGMVAQIYGPYLAQPTAFRSTNVDAYANAWLPDYAGTHNQSTAYDGFTLSVFNNNLTLSGRIAVYGMRK